MVRAGDTPIPLTLPPPVTDYKDRARSVFEGTLGKVIHSFIASRDSIYVQS